MGIGSLKKIMLLIGVLTLIAPPQLSAADPAKLLHSELLPAINHLLMHMESDKNVPLDLDLIPEILDFVDAPKELGESMSVGEYDDAVSDYYEFSVARSMAEVLDLVYNPAIPSYVTLPSSVRRSHWIEINGKAQNPPRLSDELNDLDKPFIMKGVEFIENSPDTTSGAYYAYNLDRLLILMKHKDRPVLISLSIQPDISEVGKKGLVIGDDDEWNYIYSGEKGTSLPGLGWADTYMYGSASIMVYYETNTNPKQVKCGVFKWLSAGWLGLNFVQSNHIRKGLERFAKDFRDIVESSSLSDTASLARMFQKIQNLSTEELRAKSKVYYNQIIRRFQYENSGNEKWLTRFFNDQNFIKELNREEMQALVNIEYLKYKMGKPHRFDTSYFTPPIVTKKRS